MGWSAVCDCGNLLVILICFKTESAVLTRFRFFLYFCLIVQLFIAACQVDWPKQMD